MIFNNTMSSSSGQIFYGLGVNPDNGNIWVADAVDYQQKGVFFHYTPDGTLIEQVTAGVIPNGVIFY